jgi:hypothetical protein
MNIEEEISMKSDKSKRVDMIAELVIELGICKRWKSQKVLSMSGQIKLEDPS